MNRDSPETVERSLFERHTCLERVFSFSPSLVPQFGSGLVPSAAVFFLEMMRRLEPSKIKKITGLWKILLVNY
jgi:hypothetical protein